MTDATQVRAASRSTSLLWTAWIAFSLFINFDLGGGIYSSQLLLILFGLCWLAFRLFAFDLSKAWVPLALLAFTVWSLLIRNTGGSGRFLPEFGKWAVIALSFTILTDLKVESSFDSITLALPMLTSALTLLTRLFGNWDTYDPVLHRLGVPQLGGSPNTAGYVFAFCLLMTHYQWSRKFGLVTRAALAASFLILIYAMLASQSRGGLLIYVAGLLFFLKPRRRVAAFIALGAVVAGMTLLSFSSQFERFNLIVNARDTGGTGRVVIWAQLLGNLLQDPVRIFIGNGPGAINFYLFGVYLIQSAHSVYVETLYSYGLLGLALLFAWLTMLYKNGVSRTAESHRRSLNMAIWFGLLIGLALDSDPMTAQILWFTPLLGALMMSKTPPLALPAPERLSLSAEPPPRPHDRPEISF